MKGQISNYGAAIVLLAITASIIFYLIMVYPQERAKELSDQNTIVIRNFAFNPDVLEVSCGTTVKWINYDNVVHSISSAAFGVDISPGNSYSYKFSNPGIYDYSSSKYPYMKGKIIVR